MRKAIILFVRQKHRQTAWTPSSQGGGSSPHNAVAGHEILQMMYSPVPLECTVDYEEDFGNSLILQREYIPKKHRDRLSHELAPLCYSEVELKHAKNQLASQMNRERSDRATQGEGAPFEQDVDPHTGRVVTARYLFNEERMMYCERFKRKFPEDIYSPLMETCAILFGCKDASAREALLVGFLNLDSASLARDKEKVDELIADKQQLRDQIPTVGGGNSEALEKKLQLPDEFLEIAPALKSYLALCRGEIRTLKLDSSTAQLLKTLKQKTKWRRIVDACVAEDYHLLSAEQVLEAKELSELLHTLKFMDIKLDDAVREIVELQHRNTYGVADHTGSPGDRSADHPERRA